jgi:hypothetical protein
MDADETLARVYYLGRSQYVRDPRSGHREGRSRDVLRGGIDGFLFAFLRHAQERRALAATSVPATNAQERTNAASGAPRAGRTAVAPVSGASGAHRVTRSRASPAP